MSAIQAAPLSQRQFVQRNLFNVSYDVRLSHGFAFIHMATKAISLIQPEWATATARRRSRSNG
jgi:hypothetical protein